MEKIKNAFLVLLKEIKKGLDECTSAPPSVSAELFRQIVKDAPIESHDKVTADQVAETVLSAIQAIMPMDDESREQFVALYKRLAESAGKCDIGSGKA